MSDLVNRKQVVQERPNLKRKALSNTIRISDLPSSSSNSYSPGLPVNSTEPRAKRPRYLRDFIWNDDAIATSPTALSSETDHPLPRPPSSEFTLPVVKTITQNRRLFKIVTPINIEAFESLLVTHPNQPFVKSVIHGLRFGFWPWASTNRDELPLTWDASDRPPKTDASRDFIRAQRDIEIAAGRFSESFGKDLLPGMYSMPIHTVPKPRSEKLRLVVDHSASKFSLNSMIPHDAIAGGRLDTLKDLGQSLIEYRRIHGDHVELVVFKSDVSGAYRRMPMHPLWQIKQIITIDEERYVDHNNNFGNRGAQRIWAAFMALVNWIAINIRGLKHIKVYTDDNFSFEVSNKVRFYKPYDTFFPEAQTLLLELWDELGVPHDRPKQEFGKKLTIIGFEVDPNAMTFTMSETSRAELREEILDFCRMPSKRKPVRRSLKRFQQIAGWINWSLNVFPLLKPALSNIYDKISGKDENHAGIAMNQSVIRDLHWFLDHLVLSSGVNVIDTSLWSSKHADLVIYCDASLAGLGFYYPSSSTGYQAHPPSHTPPRNILYLEALCICWAVHHAENQGFQGKLLVFTDSDNSYHIFNTLRAKPLYNEIVKSTVDILARHTIDLRVEWINGESNVVADALSRWKNDIAIQTCPNLHIDTWPIPTILPPPRHLL